MELRIGHLAEPDGRSVGSAPDREATSEGASGAARPAEVAARVTRSVARGEYLPALGGISVLAGTIIHVGWLFWTVAPHDRLVPWLVYMGGILTALLAGFPIAAVTRTRARDLAGFWRAYVYVLMSACNLGVAVSVWLLLPPAEPMLKLYMVFLYVWYLTVQLLATHGTNHLFDAAVGLITGSLVAFWLSHEVPMREAVAAFLVLFGVTALLLRHAIRQAIREAITARHLAEDAHRQLQAALAEVSAERDAKTRFIAAASHDLQQPIQAARLYFEQLVATEPSARARILAGGREAFRAVQTLLEDMLEHLRLDARAVAARPEPVALEPLFEELALQYAAAAAVAGMQIVTRSTPCIARADRRLLRRALGNLIDNAIKHSGGRRVEVSAGPTATGAVEIRVADDGGGISAGNAARLFDREFSVRHTSRSSVAGFGLGLPSAHRIAELLGGTLQLAPSTGRGCDFRLVLPAAEARGS